MTSLPFAQFHHYHDAERTDAGRSRRFRTSSGRQLRLHQITMKCNRGQTHTEWEWRDEGLHFRIERWRSNVWTYTCKVMPLNKQSALLQEALPTKRSDDPRADNTFIKFIDALDWIEKALDLMKIERDADAKAEEDAHALIQTMTGHARGANTTPAAIVLDGPARWKA